MLNGKRHTEGTKQKMSELKQGENNPRYGKKCTEGTKRKISEARKGYRHTEEVKRKISESHKGITHTEESKQKISEARKGKYAGKNNPRYGKKCTEGTKRKMSRAKEGKYICENNPNWKGGLSFEPYSPVFNNKLKEQIRERDNYLCQFCGINENGRKHDVHHINYNKKDCRPINLIATCQDCNKKANTERDKWELFFTILQEIRRI